MRKPVSLARVRQAIWAAAALVAGLLLAVAVMPREAPDDALDAASFERGQPRERIEAPSWDVGDAWRVQFDDGEPICWLVVVAAEADVRQQGVWCESDEAEEIAAQIAAYEVPYVGRFTSTLDGLQRDTEPFRFYDWPLADGKAWATTYQGDPVEVLTVYDADDGRYRFEVTRDGERFLEYDYDPSLEWWSRLEFEGGYTLRVHEHGRDWSGTVVFATTEERFRADRTVLDVAALPASFQVGQDEYGIALSIEFAGLRGGHISLRDGTGSPVYESSDLDTQASVFSIVSGVPGSWTFLDETTGAGEMYVRASAIAIQSVELG